METSSSCKKELVGEYIGDGEKHTCSFSHEGEESEGLSLMGEKRKGGKGREGERWMRRRGEKRGGEERRSKKTSR